ncbi:hypothetical protein SUDANB95_04484 [Actinosynnema sp. ALI-1.44]
MGDEPPGRSAATRPEPTACPEYSNATTSSSPPAPKVKSPWTPSTITTTPATDGPVSIEVSGVDRAGNRSPARSYRY